MSGLVEYLFNELLHQGSREWAMRRAGYSDGGNTYPNADPLEGSHPELALGPGRVASVARGLYNFFADRLPSGLGDLTQGEVAQIQGVVDKAGRPLDVVGSAAGGSRNARSDIDYVVSPGSMSSYRGLEGKLPAVDPKHGLNSGYGNAHQGPVIRFEARARPTFVSPR